MRSSSRPALQAGAAIAYLLSLASLLRLTRTFQEAAQRTQNVWSARAMFVCFGLAGALIVAFALWARHQPLASVSVVTLLTVLVFVGPLAPTNWFAGVWLVNQRLLAVALGASVATLAVALARTNSTTREPADQS